MKGCAIKGVTTAESSVESPAAMDVEMEGVSRIVGFELSCVVLDLPFLRMYT